MAIKKECLILAGEALCKASTFRPLQTNNFYDVESRPAVESGRSSSSYKKIEVISAFSAMRQRGKWRQRTRPLRRQLVISPKIDTGECHGAPHDSCAGYGHRSTSGWHAYRFLAYRCGQQSASAQD